MYASLLGEINYTLLGVAYQLSTEAIGIGYVRADIGDSQIISYRDPATGRIIPTDEGAIGYLSSVAILSYGGRISRFIKHESLKDVNVGASVKIFNQELKGGSYEALASGLDLDIGAQWQYKPWLRFAFFGQNVLPYSSGGVLRWTSGIEETIPSVWKLGVGAKVIGWDAPWEYYDHEVFVDFDVELSPYDRPGLNHIGLEWWPVEYVALRLGIDQDAVSTGDGIGVDNNLTAGVGLFYKGFEFDYAFHQFGSVQENNTHYFSMSIGVDKDKRPEHKPIIKSKYINSIYPSSEAIIFGQTFNITGEVEPEVTILRINGISTEAKNGSFSLTYEFPETGKNAVSLEAFNEAGRKIDQLKLKVLCLPVFSDVSKDYWTHKEISLIAAINLVQGYPDGGFRPEGDITRAELTTMLIRANKGVLKSYPGSLGFKDIVANHWAEPYIKVASETGIVKGYPDKTFRPSLNVNRAEGVVLITRFAKVKEPIAVTKKPFLDLPISHWAIKTIFAAKDAGMLEYLLGRKFDPKRNLTRAEAVEILSRTPFAKGKINELLDFSAGY